MMIFRFFVILVLSMALSLNAYANDNSKDTASGEHVLVIDMDLLILPGTGIYLEQAINEAEKTGAKALIVKLNTPGGMLQTSQEMIKAIFASKVPVIVYVSPSGSTATSAGVFITMAAHVAAMAPGTSLGAAHPVTGDGKDIEGDMRKKAENMTTALVRSITEQRGRNVEWVEKAVRESESLTAKEAMEKNVVDIIARDIDTLLKLSSGRKIKLVDKDYTIPDLTKCKQVNFELKLKEKLFNVLANPQILALLWLAAVTGLFMELKNPGLIVPGTVGVICLVLALSVTQIIPINQGGILLLLLGAVLIGMELFIPSGFLGFAGLVSMVLGTLYLVDVSKAPGLEVDIYFAVTLAIVFGGGLYIVIRTLARDLVKNETVGYEGLIGQIGKVSEDLNPEGMIFVEGAFWKAVSLDGDIAKDEKVKVVEFVEGDLCLKVRKV